MGSERKIGWKERIWKGKAWQEGKIKTSGIESVIKTMVGYEKKKYAVGKSPKENLNEKIIRRKERIWKVSEVRKIKMKKTKEIQKSI